MNACNRQWLNTRKYLKTTMLLMCTISKSTKFWGSMNLLIVLSLPAHLHFETQTYRRRYNLSSSSEIFVFLPKDMDIIKSLYDVILQGDEHHLKHINECHLVCLFLYYVLFFSYGKFGWHSELRHQDGQRILCI